MRTRSIRGLFLVLAPATVAAAPLGAFDSATGHAWIVVAVVAGMLAMAGLGHQVGAVRLRAVATVAFLTWTVGTLVEHGDHPGRGLIVLLGMVAFMAFSWPTEKLRRFAVKQRALHMDQELVITSIVAAFFGFDAWQHDADTTIASRIALMAVYAVPAVLALRRRKSFRGLRRQIALHAAGVLALVPLASVVARLAGASIEIMPLGLISPLTIFVLAAHGVFLHRIVTVGAARDPGLLDAVLLHPSRVMVVSFVAVCAVGTLVLALPISSASGQALSWLDAAFTAVSATCVTGLVVVDTPHAFSGFGQFAVLGLIQVGGLGIMLFSAAAMVLLGKRLSLSHERVAVDIFGASGRAGLVRAIRSVVVATAVTEALAALLLFFGFLAHGDDLASAAWRGVFTAISAFCNAGFALQSDSLIPYAHSPYVLAVVGATIIVGGLGPGVVAAVLSWSDRTQRTLHVRLVLWTTAFLLVVPAVFITAFEWERALASMSLVDKLGNGLFQSITLRTAGFNSIDLAQIHPATWTTMILAMFVGGSPGSTAGGVKTTTIAVVILALASVIRGRERVEIFGRTLPTTTVMRANAVTTLAVLGACVGLAAIQLTQAIRLDTALFEVVSALATVGLSTGGTSALDEVGKVIIITCMFAGRVGPLTLFIFLASHTQAQATRHYPEESVPIG